MLAQLLQIEHWGELYGAAVHLLELAETEGPDFLADACHGSLEESVLGQDNSRNDDGHYQGRCEPIADVHDGAVHDDSDVQVLYACLI